MCFHFFICGQNHSAPFIHSTFVRVGVFSLALIDAGVSHGRCLSYSRCLIRD